MRKFLCACAFNFLALSSSQGMQFNAVPQLTYEPTYRRVAILNNVQEMDNGHRFFSLNGKYRTCPYKSYVLNDDMISQDEMQPLGLKIIKPKEFYNCYLLIAISIPNSVTKIGEGAFNSCSNLEKIIFEKSSQLEVIGESAFIDCTALEKIVIPSRVRTIGEDAFNGCKSLQQVIFEVNSDSKEINFEKSSQLEVIDNCAFIHCTALKKIVIPSSVRIIGEGAFSGCKNLQQVIFAAKSKLTSIGNGAFYTCLNLTEITIPQSVKQIGNDAFHYCSSLRKINFEEPSQLEVIEAGTFDSCNSLIDIIIPDNIKCIKNLAFGSCRKLEKIEIQSKDIVIESNAFYYCIYINNVIFQSNGERKIEIKADAFPAHVQVISESERDKNQKKIKLNKSKNSIIPKDTVVLVI